MEHHFRALLGVQLIHCLANVRSSEGNIWEKSAEHAHALWTYNQRGTRGIGFRPIHLAHARVVQVADGCASMRVKAVRDCVSHRATQFPFDAAQCARARVAKLVNARDLKSLGRKAMSVRFRPRAPLSDHSITPAVRSPCAACSPAVPATPLADRRAPTRWSGSRLPPATPRRRDTRAIPARHAGRAGPTTR